MTAVNWMAAQGLRCAHDPRPDPYTLTLEEEWEQAMELACDALDAPCPDCGEHPEAHVQDEDGDTYCPPPALTDDDLALLEWCVDCACPLDEHDRDIAYQPICPDVVYRPLRRIVDIDTEFV